MPNYEDEELIKSGPDENGFTWFTPKPITRWDRWIVELRSQHDITRPKLAELLGIGEDAIEKLERGTARPTEKLRKKLIDLRAELEGYHRQDT